MQKQLFQTVILAGGLATRLRPVTEKIPKALIDINGEPFIAHQLRLLHRQGVRNVVMCVGFLGEMLQDYLGDGQQFGIEVHYSFDGDTLLGTAGSIKKASSQLDDNFFVLYGDSYLPCNFVPVQYAFLQQQKPALMTVFNNYGKWDTSNVEFLNGKILKYDKVNRTEQMHHIDYGLGVFNKKAFDDIPENTTYDLALLYQRMLIEQKLSSCEIHDRFYEVGSFAGIEELGYYLTQCSEAI